MARQYDKMDRDTVATYFSGSPHTSWAGAVLNAETVISGLKALKKDPVTAYYIDQVKQISPAPAITYPAVAAAETPAPPAPAAPAATAVQ